MFAEEERVAFLSPRRCFREPVPEIALAAERLNEGLERHLRGDCAGAERAIVAADIPTVREWCEPLLGSETIYPERSGLVRFRVIADAPAVVPKADRLAVRMPSAAQKAALVRLHGLHCAFCGIPLIRKEVRVAFQSSYPNVVRWGGGFADCHAAFLCMWLQYDHLLPHARGGTNDLDNVALTCSGCNYGRMSLTLAEVGLLDPRTQTRRRSEWDGLERILARQN